MHGSVLEYIRCGMASLQQSAAVLVSGSVFDGRGVNACPVRWK